MQRFALKRTGLVAVAVGGLAVGGLLVVASRGETQGSQQPFSNGGAKEWVAFDPVTTVTSTAQSLNMIRIIKLASTSTAASSFSVTYERTSNPARVNICSGTLQPGQIKVCGGVGRASNGFADGYIQVRASQPLVVGGYIDLPVQAWEQKGSGTSTRLKFSDNGTLTRVQYEWQQGCPIKSGSGCPTGQPVFTPGR